MTANSQPKVDRLDTAQLAARAYQIHRIGLPSHGDKLLCNDAVGRLRTSCVSTQSMEHINGVILSQSSSAMSW